MYRADVELVRRALDEDGAAMDHLTRRLRCVPPILAARNARLGRPLDEHELADLSQEALIRIWRKLATFSGRSRFETWVYGICRLELMNSFRRKRRGPRASVDYGGEPPPDPPTNDPPSALDYEHVYESLERLGSPEADVVRLKHFDGLTFEEIGATLDISPNTAKTQYYRGLERLRIFLSGAEEDTP